MDVTTIVFAVLAIFVVWKLRSVLGTRTGHEQRPMDVYRPRETAPVPEPTNTVLKFPGTSREDAAAEPLPEDRRTEWLKVAGVDGRVLPGLEAVASSDPGFDPKSFLDGAKVAYEMIIMSFAAGNRAALRDLLSKDVYESFSAAIADREQRGETVDTTFVSIDKAGLEDAQMRGATAQITVRFQSKLITATRDRTGVVVDGNADKVVDMIDVWTFAREAKARDPNWRLVATEAGA